MPDENVEVPDEEIELEAPEAEETPEVETPVAETPAEGEKTPETMQDAVEAALAAVTAPVADKKVVPPVEGVKPEEKPEVKLDADGKPIVEKPVETKKVADPVNDPIPVQVSERTRERITALVGLVKEKDVKVQEYAEFLQHIESTGASADNFAQMMGYMRAVNSDKPEDMELAYQMLRSELEGLALKMGKPLPEVDLLAGEPELAEEVRLGHMPKARAEELAVSRKKITNATATVAATRTQATQEQALATARTEATAALTALGAKLSKEDTDYARKFTILTPALKPILSQLHPSRWAATVAQAFAACKLPPAPAAVVPVVPDKQQPLRPKTPAGDGQKVAGSMLDAVNAALEGR